MEQIITELSVQKKNPNRVNVFLDGEFAFGLSRIVAAWLEVGHKLKEEDIEILKEKDTLEIITQRILHFLSYRPRSEKEIRNFLSLKGYEESKIDIVIDRMKNSGMVDDLKFAEKWIENRSLNRPKGRRALTVELMQKGISREDIHESLALLKNEKELAVIAGKKYSNRLGINDKVEFRKKMGAFLLRRGFDYEITSEAVEEIWHELQASQNID